MATWQYKKVEPSDINSGNQYQEYDGLTSNDMNKIVAGLLYAQNNYGNDKVISIVDTTTTLPLAYITNYFKTNYPNNAFGDDIGKLFLFTLKNGSETDNVVAYIRPNQANRIVATDFNYFWYSDANYNFTSIEVNLQSIKTKINSLEDWKSSASETIDSLQQSADALEETVTTNTQNITTNKNNITTNKNNITTNKNNITTNKNNIGTLSSLNTTAKSNLVSAINEVNSKHLYEHFIQVGVSTSRYEFNITTSDSSAYNKTTLLSMGLSKRVGRGGLTHAYISSEQRAGHVYFDDVNRSLVFQYVQGGNVTIYTSSTSIAYFYDTVTQIL